MSIGQLHPHESFLQHFHDYAFNLDGAFSWHVRISGPDAVINTVCSKWADSEPSSVTAVQPSLKIFTPGRPALTMGSIAKVMPASNLHFGARVST